MAMQQEEKWLARPAAELPYVQNNFTKVLQIFIAILLFVPTVTGRCSAGLNRE